MASQKIQALTEATSVAFDAVLPVVVTPGSTPADNKVTVANLRKSMIGTYSYTFTGDPYVRFNVPDVTVASDSKIVVSVQRPSTSLDSDNLGYMYIANVCNIIASTGFDVDIACLDWGMGDPTESNPTETIVLCYLIG